jgi:hypothetical protein
MKKPKTEPEEQPKEDPFIEKIQKAIEEMLAASLEPKDMNALLANAIKFLLVKHRIGGDEGGSFFDE